MSNYVLVHGWNSTGETWNKVSPLLQQHKNKVFFPTLTYMGNSTLQDHISEISQLIVNEKLQDVILVGHSYAGMVITGVADKLPEKLSHLVYVDAALPENAYSSPKLPAITIQSCWSLQSKVAGDYNLKLSPITI